MSDYTPDRWVVVRIFTPEHGQVYKLLAGWSGSYLHGQSWKLNSGITKVEDDGDYLLFSGYSGSVYRCHKKGYGLNGITIGIANDLRDRIDKVLGGVFEVLPEETNFTELNYE